jgi:hypothetical protein
MKRRHLLLTVLTLLILSCQEEPEVPKPEFSAIINSTAGDWQANTGGMLFFRNQERGVVHLYLRGKRDDGSFNYLELFISDVNLSAEPPQTFDFSELSDQSYSFGEYRYSEMTSGWQPYDQKSVKINVTKVTELDGLFFISGTFEFTGCNRDSFPVCLNQTGEFINTEVFPNYDILTAWLGNIK